MLSEPKVEAAAPAAGAPAAPGSHTAPAAPAIRPLEGRVALVTGGARGIGRAIAQRLARDGAAVAVLDLQDAGDLVASLKRSGTQAVFLKTDVSDEAEVATSVAEAEKALGPVSILVNNAGVTRDGLFVRMDQADWDMVIDVNLKGAFLVSKAVVRGMMKRRSGVIINLSSVVGLSGNAGQANYSAAKAGIIGLTRSLARELASRNIRVNAVAPGYIETDMTSAMTEEAKQTARERTPLGRAGQPEDVAEAVAFLASDAAAFVTGVVLPVDGGLGM